MGWIVTTTTYHVLLPHKWLSLPATTLSVDSKLQVLSSRFFSFETSSDNSLLLQVALKTTKITHCHYWLSLNTGGGDSTKRWGLDPTFLFKLVFNHSCMQLIKSRSCSSTLSPQFSYLHSIHVSPRPLSLPLSLIPPFPTRHLPQINNGKAAQRSELRILTNPPLTLPCLL